MFKIEAIYANEAARREWSNCTPDTIYGDEKRTGYDTEAEASAACDRLSEDLPCFDGDIIGYEVLYA